MRRLAHYEVLGLLGRGGMGEVHRARDTELGREVAIKLLPPELLRDAERVARFQREARTLASLNHPQIAGLHGIEEADGQRFLVMELAEGDDLSMRIAQGPLALADALDIARQIALGLEEAHAKGIVHRDLKPANIKVSSDGAVKILDFGLARAFQGDTVDEGSLGNSPTITAAMTQPGMVLGTAAYMSPEQAKGKTVDRRADVWSFGVILWEMLTGKRLFTAETTSEVLAAVLRESIPWEELPTDLPVGVRRLLERCLERDPRSRLQDIGEARIRLERWMDDPSSLHESFVSGGPVAEGPRWRAAVPWALLVVVGGLATWGWLDRGSAPDVAAPSLAFEIRMPGDDLVLPAGAGAHAPRLSPAGDLVAFTSGGSLWLRWLDDFEVREVDGARNVRAYDFSPDGRWLAFVSAGRLYRVSITGGAPIEICATTDVRGIAWVGENTIVFPMSYTTGLSAVSLDTREVRELTTIDGARGERSHRWPRALPDGESLLITCQYQGRDYDESDIQIVSLETGERTTVHQGGSYPVYASSGHLLFARDSHVFAVELDLATRTTNGFPVPVLEDVDTSVGDQEADNGIALFDVSAQGLLLYRTANSQHEDTRVATFAFESSAVEPFGASAKHGRMSLSPDGAWLAVGRRESGQADVYLFDLSTRTEHRFTHSRGLDWPGCWGPDSRTLYWTHASGDGNYWIFRQPIDGSAPIDTIAGNVDNLAPLSISSDGRWLLAMAWSGPDGFDVLRIDLEAADRELEPFISGPANQGWARFSPDDAWVVYFTDESGYVELHLRRHPDTGAVWQPLQDVGRVDGVASWAPDGRSIVVRRQGELVSIPLELRGGAVRFGETQTIVPQGLRWIPNEADYALRPDMTGIYGLVSASGRGQASSNFVVRTNWFDEIRRRVDEGR